LIAKHKHYPLYKYIKKTGSLNMYASKRRKSGCTLQNTKHGTRNTKHETRNTKHETRNTKHETRVKPHKKAVVRCRTRNTK